jgi:hypothetical protein
MPSIATGTVRILVPNHPDLASVLVRALDFAAVLYATTDPTSYLEGEEPWELPQPLTDPDLSAALEQMLLPWARDVGDDARDTALHMQDATHEHIGVYVATTAPARLRRILAADDLLAQRPGPDAARFRCSADLAE